ncbi:Hypothetical predicted protein [Podarcis lilfordi]|uniref:Uncharacterized protein n=1 Tax=Podarcis lilfordi TaxID=74358 RepID=A0AA35JWQ5_9SAUR|nr:Hypothetical predicted protein [Podarcis lilfordi]
MDQEKEENKNHLSYTRHHLLHPHKGPVPSQRDPWELEKKEDTRNRGEIRINTRNDCTLVCCHTVVTVLILETFPYKKHGDGSWEMIPRARTAETPASTALRENTIRERLPCGEHLALESTLETCGTTEMVRAQAEELRSAVHALSKQPQGQEKLNERVQQLLNKAPEVSDTCKIR